MSANPLQKGLLRSYALDIYPKGAAGTVTIRGDQLLDVLAALDINHTVSVRDDSLTVTVEMPYEFGEPLRSRYGNDKFVRFMFPRGPLSCRWPRRRSDGALA